MFNTQPKIFISSTIIDLPNERKAALKAVEKVGGFPVMSEFTMEAQNKDSLSACLDKVVSSDIYVLILGAQYGWKPDGKESITELEYKAALSKGIPIIVFNTTYQKESSQKVFESIVESRFFRKTVNDAFELQDEIEKSLKIEIGNKQTEFFIRTEKVYSNLVKVSFPKYVYRAELNIDKVEIKKIMKEMGLRLPKFPSLIEYAISALRIKSIHFPGDWVLSGKFVLTFHDLQNPSIPLSEIIDLGTSERFLSTEIYESSSENMNAFKYLLKKCFATKLHKLKLKWFKDEKVYAFIPINKDNNERWLPRSVEWSKSKKKATRKVVEIRYDLKNKEAVFNMRCLAFRSRFEFLDNIWYLAIKPEWLFLWSNLTVSNIAFKNIQWLKKTERNMHVFNHFNFILRFLQPKYTESLFPEMNDYKFLTLGSIEAFDFAPIVPDNIWVNLEAQDGLKKMTDDSGNVDLFEI